MKSKKGEGKIIFHLTSSLGIGGAQSMMFELYHAIKKHYPHYEQEIISTDDRPADKEFVSSYGISYSPIRTKKNDSTIVSKICASKDPIVIFHKLASSNYKVIQELKKKNIPVLVISHTFYKDGSWVKADNSCCDIMVAVSNHMEKHVRQWYPKIKNYIYIHNGVNQWRYKKIKIKPITNGILWSGRCNRVCGWKFSNSWEQWVKEIKLPYGLIHDYIGDRIGSTGRKSKTRIIKGKNGNEVRMLGNISNFNEKIKIMSNWDIFLYETNREEGISMAILEALAMGIPVICSNHYGNKEIIKDGVNGYVFRTRDEAKQILKDLCKKPEKLVELKESTYKHFDKYLDARHVAKKYMDIIEKIKKPDPNINKVSEISINIPKEKKKIKDLKKFTIISSCYNKEKYLREWANSILIQKYRPLEVIVANDASTDNSLKILENISGEFKEKGIEFKLINNLERLKCGSSYKNLVQYITGFYIGVLDSDDMLADDAVEYVMKLYNKYTDISWIYTQFDICDMNMKYKRKGFCSAPKPGESLLELGRKRVHGYGHWRTFNYKIKNPNKLYGEGLECGVDKYMGYRLEEMGPGMFVDRVCYKYRQYPVGFEESVSSTKKAIEEWKKIIYEAEKRRKKYKRKAYPITVYKK